MGNSLRQNSFHESRGDGVPGMIAAIETWAMLIKRVYEIDPLACPR